MRIQGNHDVDRFQRWLERKEPRVIEPFIISEEAMAIIRDQFPETAHKFTTLPPALPPGTIITDGDKIL